METIKALRHGVSCLPLALALLSASGFAWCYDFIGKRAWQASCDLNRDGKISPKDKALFKKLCASTPAGSVCDQDRNGRGKTLKDKKLFWTRCLKADYGPARSSAMVLSSSLTSRAATEIVYRSEIHFADGLARSVSALSTADIEAAQGLTISGKPNVHFSHFPITAECAYPTGKGPYSATMVLDRSGSMHSADPSNVVLSSAGIFARNLGAGDTMALMAFPRDSSEFRPYDCTIYGNGFDGNAAGWIATLHSLTGTSGGTPLYKCANQAVGYTRDRGPTNNRAVLLFTDGEDNESGNVTASTVIQTARNAGVAVYALGLGGANAAELGRIARETGGGLTYAVDVGQLIIAYGTLGGVLSGARPTCTITMKETVQGGTYGNGESIRYVNIRVDGETVSTPITLPVYWW